MKTTEKIIKEFDTAETFREIKNKVSKEIKGMTFEKLEAYLDTTKLKSRAQILNLPNILASPGS